ncbi:conserved Plasmodium protein, unknown function [Plasmodium gallinaceum]|uniref:Uncharacterized protein n=1 Tax=Plasmodium gallinaceum TaxID=5849 RepID=A0A1J1GWM6_PLAGA|nr:conserved Plasmodium protein, unknown function [Plasmodium gallinaceum]CRG96844.1 conserved Plasmodium protein, unknown function [Plasmodium gallinaceum]
MKLNELNICIQVKCISFCSSIFFPNNVKKNGYNNNDIEKKNLDECEENNNIKLKYLIGNIYIGKVINVGENVDNIIKGKNVIGIFTVNSKIKNDEIIAPYHDIIEYPCNELKNDYSLCASFRSLYESYLCLSVINHNKMLKYIAIFAENVLQVLPLLKMLLKNQVFIIIFLPKENCLQNRIKNSLEEYHISNDSFKERVSIFSIDMNIPEHIHVITNRLGVKIIIVYPNLSIDKNILKKNIFTLSALNANLIFTYELDYLNPYECKLLFEKGVKIHFFNVNNYIYYDYFKRTNAFNYVLLSILNKDIDIPSVSLNKKYFSSMEEIFSSMPCGEGYNIYINKNIDCQSDNS